MYTKQAIRRFNGDIPLAPEQLRQFDELGFFTIENMLTPDECRVLADEFERIHAAERDQGGHEVHVEPGARRVSNIFNKSVAFDHCLELAPILSASHWLLGEFKVHGANLRDPVQGHGHQALHVDVPKRFPDDWWVLNAVVLFDDMTLDNGPTRVIPGSHRWAPINVPVVNMADWQPEDLSPEDQARVPTDLEAPYPGEVYVTAPAGAAVIMNSSLWHGGTLKRTGAPRRLLHLTYTRRDLPQQLVQRDYLTSALYERMGPEQRFLLDIEPLAAGEAVSRRKPREHAGWWN